MTNKITILKTLLESKQISHNDFDLSLKPNDYENLDLKVSDFNKFNQPKYIPQILFLMNYLGIANKDSALYEFLEKKLGERTISDYFKDYENEIIRYYSSEEKIEDILNSKINKRFIHPRSYFNHKELIELPNYANIFQFSEGDIKRNFDDIYKKLLESLKEKFEMKLRDICDQLFQDFKECLAKSFNHSMFEPITNLFLSPTNVSS